MIRTTYAAFVAQLVLSWAADASEYSYRWAATGPGHRAMAANMGLANLVNQAGILNQFEGVSTSGGATWFSTQFFYSPNFFSHTIGTPTELRDFVASWMGAYATILPSGDSPHYATCAGVGAGLNDSSFLSEFRAACPTLLDYEGNWVAYVSAMLNATSASYGDDTFALRPIDVPNKVSDLYYTALLLQTSLAPVYRNRTAGSAVYLGSYDVSSVPISSQYTVTPYERLFLTASDSIMNVWLGPDTSNFSYEAYRDFGVYPGTNGTLSIYPEARSAERLGEFDRPFRGKAPTSAQISAASSAAFGHFSGIVPSLLAQAFSHERHVLENSGLDKYNKTLLVSALHGAAQHLFNADAFDDLAVCTQYPKPCGKNDGMFVDGATTDNAALALSIGEYQSLESSDHTKTIKVLLMDSSADLAYSSWMNYFSNQHNRGVTPGGYMWHPGMMFPTRSPQIFQETIDLGNVSTLVVPIQGTNFSTLALSGTTTANSAFGVVAGQKVELFIILLRSDIPDLLIEPEQVEEYIPAVADLAFGIASSEDLLERVRDFFPVQTYAPTASPQPTSGDGTTNLHRTSRWYVGLSLLLMYAWWRQV
jgi:hypothetical protein